MSAMGLDERAFFTEKPEMRTGSYQCPRCKRTSEYSVKWVRRTRRAQPPQGADKTDLAKFAKLRDYVLRVDDEVTCKTCSKRFEIPSMNSLVFVDQLVGLPDDEALEREIAAASGEDTPPPPVQSKPPSPSTTRRSRPSS